MNRPQLYLHKQPIQSFFELLGTDENAITSSVGWGLCRSPSFLRAFLQGVVGYKGNPGGATIRLQDYQRRYGITDIEIRKNGEFHLVIEAKKGWTFPALKQLKTYAPRLAGGDYRTRGFIFISEFERGYPRTQLGRQSVNGIPIRSITWKDVRRMANRAITRGDNNEKRVLRDLVSYLRRVTSMRGRKPDEVFVVSLNRIGIGNVKRRRYSHPVGPRWPKQPPDYVAFRYHGKLQSIHHVDAFEVKKGDPLAKPRSSSRTPHFLYYLGRPIVPQRRPRTGAIFRNAPVWCFWDTLFTCKTISEARDASNRRRKKAERDATN